MNKIKFTVLSIFVLLLSSCNLDYKVLTGNYEVCWREYGWEEYTLYGNPACIGDGGDTILQDIKQLIWNKEILIMEENKNSDKNWYIIKAKGDTLKTCNDDIHLIHLTKEQVDSVVINGNYKNLKIEEFLNKY